jgi:HAMP domain-containing protein
MSAVRAPEARSEVDGDAAQGANGHGPSAGKRRAGTDGAGTAAANAAAERLLAELVEALRSAAAGHADVRLSTRRQGMSKDVAKAFNDFMDLSTRFNKELVRVSRAVGRDGRTTERIDMGPVQGMWVTRVDAVNDLIDDLIRPTNEVARVISAVAEGDLTQKMPLAIDGRPMKGEFARMGAVVNSMVDLLSAFSAEVTRVAGDVGTEGRLGGQARMRGVSGAWRDLTDNVNQMASNLTDQVRNIALVTTAVARGDLSRKITVDVRGELLELK